MSERPIWTTGMDVINRALEPDALARFRQEDIQRWTADIYKDTLRRYLRDNPDADR